jgi:SAM-dependent methyltransferase
MRYANPVGWEFGSGQFYADRAAFYLSPDKRESDFAPVRFEREIRVFRRYCPSGAALDVGCSTGAFLHELRRRFPGDYALAGNDVSDAPLAHAEGLGIEVLRGPFPDLNLGGRQFAAVTFWAVMEHLVEPGRFLKQAAAVLQPGGHCFVLVPNARSLTLRLLGPRYRYVMPEHLNYFSAATLRRWVAIEPALRLVALLSTHFNPVVLWQDFWRPPTSLVPDVERARLLRRTTAWKQRRWLAPVRLLYQAVERGLAAAGLADNLLAVLRRV